MNKHLLLIAKLVVSIGLIALVTSQTDISQVVDRIAGARIGWLVAAALFLATVVALGTARWCLVLISLGVDLPARTTLRLFLIGLFFNQTLPSSIGGDAMRVFYLWRGGTGLQKATNSVLLDRIVGLIILIIVTSAAAPHLVARLDNPIAANGLMVVLLGGWCAVLALFAFNNPLTHGLRRFRLIDFAATLSRDAVSLFSRPSIAGPTIAISIAIHAATIAIAWSLDHALGGTMSYLVYVAVMTPTILLISIPVSIAGWGVREQILIILLGAFGLGATHAVSVSILFGVVLLIGGLPGGILWLIAKRSPEAVR